MKALSIIALLLCLINFIQCTDLEINTFYIFTKYRMFYSFNTTTGLPIKSQQAPKDSNYYFYGSLSANAEKNTILFLVQDTEKQKDGLLEYDIEANKFTPLNFIEDCYGGYEFPQVWAYDEAYNFAALPSNVMNDETGQLSIFVWNFTSSELITNTLQTGPLNQFAPAYPVGSYDPTTGNYYIVYVQNEKQFNSGTTLIVYNMWTQQVVQQPVYFDILFYAPAVDFVNGQLFFMETSAFGNYQIYTVNVQAKTVTLVYTIASGKFKIPGNLTSIYGALKNSIVLFSSATANHFTTSVMDLTSQMIHSAPAYASTTLDIGYEWISGGF
ncbi:hypothetical protein CYY_003619 [Polysphondylium violaceum]|uniref:Uncharacterized protein n=1 Tax=Polysphondylium violaceum TaxID=133409 RepID=A0A8J4PZG2_9MYCE|nr:hypothetical protein CYY_003619 [Polysphondylium violaceum]